MSHRDEYKNQLFVSRCRQLYPNNHIDHEEIGHPLIPYGIISARGQFVPYKDPASEKTEELQMK